MQLHDYASPDRAGLIVPKRSSDYPLKRKQVIHFDRAIRAGDVLRCGANVFDARAWTVVASFPHPQGVKGVYWATLEPAVVPVTVGGVTYCA
jgi:hypothetical protein